MEKNRRPVLWIVIPCFNEEAVLPKTAPLFLYTLNDLIQKEKISGESRILFVDDGSQDGTWDLIRSFAASDPAYLGIRQSRNRGHQNAVFAGLAEANGRCDITISIDCDGQDDPAAMEEMVDAYMAGSEIVYGVRKSRNTDTAFKRGTARAYYRLLERMHVEAVYDHADYRLIGSRALEHFLSLEDTELFLRGMVPLIGFPSSKVYYERTERLAGESHYPLRKMIALAKRGLFGFSVRPVEMIEKTGITIGLLGGIVFLVSLIFLIARAASGNAVAGADTAAIIGSIFLACGLILFAVGIVGEYAARAGFEVRKHPRYIISERTFEEPDQAADRD